MQRLLRAGIPVLILALAAAFSGCGGKSQSGKAEKPNGSSMPHKSIEQALKDNTPKWMALAGVVGTGLSECDGKPCIRVFVTAKSDSLSKEIPSEVDGYPVEIEITGEFKANNGR
jgi:hypothetical protein